MVGQREGTEVKEGYVCVGENARTAPLPPLAPTPPARTVTSPRPRSPVWMTKWRWPCSLCVYVCVCVCVIVFVCDCVSLLKPRMDCMCVCVC